MRTHERASGSVLLIDDSAVILDGMRSTLAASGFSVRTTTDLTNAPGLVSTSELVIVDYHMPGIDGGKLLPSLRRATLPDQICLFYLYTSDPEIGRQYDRYGFDGGLIKKGDNLALVPQVEAAFRTIRMRQLAKELKSRRSEPDR